MNTPFSFAFHNTNIRVFQLDGQPWFVARDACAALDMSLMGGTGPWLNRLAKDERRPVPKGLLYGKGMSQATLITESGLYKLIMRSDKPEAREFQEWVTRVVLPTLRKDGMYIVGEERHSVEGLTAEEIYKLALVLPTEQLPVITTHLSEQLRCLRGLEWHTRYGGSASRQPTRCGM